MSEWKLKTLMRNTKLRCFQIKSEFWRRMNFSRTPTLLLSTQGIEVKKGREKFRL